jgi:acyl-CoA reductase-like NAD-dependent aldehyde dehydrogenase
VFLAHQITEVPVGVVVIIPPWNAPYVLAARAIATAIAAGCTVVLKGSETCPATHLALAMLFAEAGGPPGLVNMVVASREGGPACTEALFANSAVRKIDFIGSAAVGRLLGAQASKYLKPITLELGGKCPAIVLDDANLEQAARLCADGALRHHGQVCFSTERVIVLGSVADRFLPLLKRAMEEFRESGTAVSAAVAEHALGILKDAEERGCKFLCGSAVSTGPGSPCSLQPTVVLDPPNDARVVDEVRCSLTKGVTGDEFTLTRIDRKPLALH